MFNHRSCITMLSCFQPIMIGDGHLRLFDVISSGHLLYENLVTIYVCNDESNGSSLKMGDLEVWPVSRYVLTV